LTTSPSSSRRLGGCRPSEGGEEGRRGERGEAAEIMCVN
jgi:hypothetical protein